MARKRGETCLEYAMNYLNCGDVQNAIATAIEGRRLCHGSIFLVVQQQLDDLIGDIQRIYPYNTPRGEFSFSAPGFCN
jgi:hypothetical protein